VRVDQRSGDDDGRGKEAGLPKRKANKAKKQKKNEMKHNLFGCTGFVYISIIKNPRLLAQAPPWRRRRLTLQTIIIAIPRFPYALNYA